MIVLFAEILSLIAWLRTARADMSGLGSNATGDDENASMRANQPVQRHERAGLAAFRPRKAIYDCSIRSKRLTLVQEPPRIAGMSDEGGAAVHELFLSIRRPVRRLGLTWGLVLGTLASAMQPAQAGTLTIVPTFDSTITGAANAVQIEAAIDSAVGTIDGLYSTLNAVTDNVYFQLGPGSFLARSNDGFFGESYTSYTNALKADSTANPSNTVLSTAIANLSKGNDSSGASPIAATTGLL